jgi:hypothetical protein
MSQQLTKRFKGGRGSKEKGNSQKSEGEKNPRNQTFIVHRG